MVRRMSEARVEDERAVVAEISRALDDDVAPESMAWWQYLLVVTELGHGGARQLVREVEAVEAAGGMTTKDGSRRRTRGGVFFVLAYEQLGPKRAKSVRWRAQRRFQEEMVQRFLRLLALVLPASGERPAASVASAAPAKVLPPLEVAPGAPAAKPAKRREPEAVEVLVVRRRPTASASPNAKPGAGR